MKISAERVLERLEAIYRCGLQPDGSHTRMVFSPEDVKGRALFTSWAEQLGMKSRQDAAGNLIFRLEGREAGLPAIVMGSHLDTVPDGGKYDGVLGCVGALEVCEVFAREGHTPRHPIEIIVYTDEEGFRFGKGLLGSSAICGQDTAISDDDTDIYGAPRGQVMASYGIRSADVGQARRDPAEIYCCLELHIEQGARLSRAGKSIGVVSSIAGVDRYDVLITGEANHAGSTAMADRHDALVAAAGFINQVPEVVKRCGNEFTVATVGTIKVTPHSVNVIPGTCAFSLEIRDQYAQVMRTVETELRALLDEICARYGVSSTFTPTSRHDPAPMTDWVRESVEQAAKESGLAYSVLPSGAFHDSLILAAAFPTGMLFVPSEKGLSHCRQEYTKDADVENGCNVLLQTVLKIDDTDR